MEERKRLAAELIFRFLPVDGSEVQWSGLKEQAKRENVSTATLAGHLKDFVKKGLAERRVDSSAYPPRVYYCRKASLPSPSESKRSSEELAKVRELGFDVDKYVSAKTRLELTMLVAYIPMMFREAMNIKDAYYSWKLRHHDLKEPGEDKVPFQPRSEKEAHGVMDTIIDVYFRPRAHALLAFQYLKDPRDDKLVLCNKGVWNELADLENFSAEMSTNESVKIVSALEMKRLGLGNSDHLSRDIPGK